MHVVDASVWVSHLIDAEAHHETSLRWLSQEVDQGHPIAAPVLLLAEVAGAITRRTGLRTVGDRAADLLQRLPNSRLVGMDFELAQLAVRAAAEFRLRGADAVYVALAARLGVPLVTWDRDQRERAGSGIHVLTPEEAMAS